MKEKPFIIGINGEYELGPDAIFFSNKKRYENMELGSKKNTILTTSNIGGVKKGNLVFNYGTYLAKGCGVSDNALLMLLNILKAVKVENRKTGEQQEIACDGLFVAIGLIPENEPFQALADLNSYGYFDSDEQCLTRTPGIFAAGDCRSKNVRQLTTAVADGATAALAACRYINELG